MRTYNYTKRRKMFIKQPVNKDACFTSVINLYHLFYTFNIKEVLVDKQCKQYLQNVFDIVASMKVDFNITEPVERDYLKATKLKSVKNAFDYLTSNNLKQKYDLLVVHRDNFKNFIPLMHRTVFIFVTESTEKDPGYCLYTKVNDCFEGILYMNDFHSIIFEKERLTFHEQTYVRDKPFRFLKMQSLLLQKILDKQDKKGVIVEIGSSRTVLKHDIQIINPMCCNDSHSTFFWCLTECKVHTVDINSACKSVLEKGYDDGYLKINGHLKIHTEDGIKFLEDYVENHKKNQKKYPCIDFLFLDAWDVIAGKDYAEKHLEAFKKAEHALSETCIIGIDDTDVGGGGKGRLLVPHLLQDGWVMLCRGRHTVMFKGSLDNLF